MSQDHGRNGASERATYLSSNEYGLGFRLDLAALLVIALFPYEPAEVQR